MTDDRWSGYGYQWVEIILIYIIYYIILYILILVYIVFQLSLLMVRRCVLSVICQLSPVASIENSLYFSSILCFSTCFFKKSAKSVVFHFLSSHFCRVPAGSRGRHTDKERFEILSLVGIWTISKNEDNKQETLTLLLYTCLMGSLYTDWRGLLFITHS